jgi:hypothetical protein
MRTQPKAELTEHALIFQPGAAVLFLGQRRSGRYQRGSYSAKDQETP